MSFAIGYIFSTFLKRPVSDENYDPLKFYRSKSQVWENIKFATMAAAPAVVLHELAHKFVAMGFGAKAVLYAPYGFYLLVVLLKAIGFPFIFFVGGFVAHSPLPALQSALVSLAGPLTNFLIWLFITLGIKHKFIKRKHYSIAVPLGRISLFLAIFNMLPLPGFDGFHFFTSLFQAF
jgi:Zn-dependent protease